MNLYKKIIKNRKYVFIGLILIMVFLSGKNYGDSSDINAQKKIEALKSELIQQNSLTILPSAMSGEKKISGIGKDNFYRIVYGCDVRDLNSSYQTKSANLSMFLVSEMGQRQLLDQLEVHNNLIIKHRSVEFQAKGDSEKIIFEKDNQDFSSTISVSNFEISLLQVMNETELKKLNKTSFGLLGEKIILEIGKNASKEIVFRSSGQSVGEFFVPKEKTISGFDFKLKFIGSGGLGSYFVELREASADGTEVGSVISKYYFNKNTATDNFKVGPSTYHFPIAQNLIPGNRYYVGISNAEVKTSFFHTLAIISGAPTESKIEYGIEMKAGKFRKKIGNLFLRIYMPKSGGLLFGGRLEDVGDGRIKYTYKQNDNPLDFLDVYSHTGSEVYFDNNYGGIVGKPENNSEYIFKFDQQKIIRKVGIEFDDLGQGIVNSLGYYSYDGKNWQKISVSEINFATTGKFRQSLIPEGETTSIYIKITYDPNDVKYKSFQFFGVQSLRVTMEMDI